MGVALVIDESRRGRRGCSPAWRTIAPLGPAVAVVLALLPATAALAADVSPGWGSWWLPPDRSTHGHGIDTLFVWIFWITVITFIGVQTLLIIFLIKYRHRPDRKKAVFTHGNTRLEMLWTLTPALILAGLALGSKKVWDNYRYSPSLNDPDRARVMVIGERFKWNIIYPGPDGEFGRYLVFPQPSDATWPVGRDGKPTTFEGVPGPASLPYERAMDAIKNYNLSINPLGKDYADPKGKDDNFEDKPGRPMMIPVNRPVEVVLSSKDVLHDFFLPNYRVKLDAVPGMRGRLVFTATRTSAQMEDESRRKYTIDELIAAVKRPENSELTIQIEEGTPGADFYKQRGISYWRYADKEKKTIIRAGGIVTPDVAQKLKDAGITEVTAYLPGTWDLVCEELCGEGHYTMRGTLIVLTEQEYDAKKWDRLPGTPPGPPTTAPAVAMK
jgi:heme/copper-type cytochrome/quinol oxidase subunit 2